MTRISWLAKVTDRIWLEEKPGKGRPTDASEAASGGAVLTKYRARKRRNGGSCFLSSIFSTRQRILVFIVKLRQVRSGQGFC
jgi:hypothetical protein